MIPPDLALAQLINRTATAFVQNAPAYITYREHTHVTAPTLGRSQEINRAVQVRQADDFAVMQDLPQGAQRTGPAFPIIPYFDPFSQFSLSWFANLKRVDINLQRQLPGLWPIPQADPSVDAVIPYASFWTPSYLPDSTPARLHIRISPTSLYPNHAYYPSEVLEDPQSHLPARIEMRATGTDEVITLYYAMLQGHWTIVRGTFQATQHVAFLTFTVVSDTTYNDIVFPTTAPDPRLATPPSPQGAD